MLGRGNSRNGPNRHTGGSQRLGGNPSSGGLGFEDSHSSEGLGFQPQNIPGKSKSERKEKKGLSWDVLELGGNNNKPLNFVDANGNSVYLHDLTNQDALRVRFEGAGDDLSAGTFRFFHGGAIIWLPLAKISTEKSTMNLRIRDDLREKWNGREYAHFNIVIISDEDPPAQDIDELTPGVASDALRRIANMHEKGRCTSLQFVTCYTVNIGNWWKNMKAGQREIPSDWNSEKVEFSCWEQFLAYWGSVAEADHCFEDKFYKNVLKVSETSQVRFIGPLNEEEKLEVAEKDNNNVHTYQMDMKFEGQNADGMLVEGWTKAFKPNMKFLMTANLPGILQRHGRGSSSEGLGSKTSREVTPEGILTKACLDKLATGDYPYGYLSVYTRTNIPKDDLEKIQRYKICYKTDTSKLDAAKRGIRRYEEIARRQDEDDGPTPHLNLLHAPGRATSEPPSLAAGDLDASLLPFHNRLSDRQQVAFRRLFTPGGSGWSFYRNHSETEKGYVNAVAILGCIELRKTALLIGPSHEAVDHFMSALLGLHREMMKKGQKKAPLRVVRLMSNVAYCRRYLESTAESAPSSSEPTSKTADIRYATVQELIKRMHCMDTYTNEFEELLQSLASSKQSYEEDHRIKTIYDDYSTKLMRSSNVVVMTAGAAGTTLLEKFGLKWDGIFIGEFGQINELEFINALTASGVSRCFATGDYQAARPFSLSKLRPLTISPLERLVLGEEAESGNISPAVITNHRNV